MQQKIIATRSASELNAILKTHIEDGWIPIGSHTVIEVHHQLRYSGMQHKDTVIEIEYAQTVRKD